MEKYFCTSVRILPALDLKIVNEQISIMDNAKNLSFPLKQINGNIDVFSIFSVLFNYVPSDVYSVVGIINHALEDPKIPGDIIAGRACGNRVCVVCEDEDEKQFYATILHECMHTVGLGHCVAWDCIMNSGMSNCINLCPMDLRKLQLAIRFDVKKRYIGLAEHFQGEKWAKEKEWARKIMIALEESVGKKDGVVDVVRKKMKIEKECRQT